MSLLAADDIAKRQEEVLHEAGLRWEGKHPDQIAARKAERERVISLERQALVERARSEAVRRGFSFEIPDVPGDGWASRLLRQKLLGIFCFARDKFVDLIEAEERVALAKRVLGGQAFPNTIPHPQIGDLREARTQLDIAEAHFDGTLGECDKRREKLADPEFLAKLEAANAIVDPFAGYIEENMPEERAITEAVTMYLEACASMRDKHEAALARSSQAVQAALRLGLSSSDLPEQTRDLAAHAGFGVVHRAAVRAANDARKRLFRGEVQVLSDYAVPDWHDPYV